jgi:hypothetical protein
LNQTRRRINRKDYKDEQTMKSLRRADRTVLKDFPRNYTLIPQDLTDPSRCKIEETELTRKYFQEDVTQKTIENEGHVSCFDTTQSQVKNASNPVREYSFYRQHFSIESSKNNAL